MSDTPRTDAKGKTGDGRYQSWRRSVDAEFARQLERKLNEVELKLALARRLLDISEGRHNEQLAQARRLAQSFRDQVDLFTQTKHPLPWETHEEQ